MKNENISSLDLQQMQLRTLDESNDAQRVVLVGQDLSIDSDKIATAIKEGLSHIKLEQPEVVTQQIPIMQQENKIQVVEVPTIIDREVIREVQVHIPIIETRIERVEIPVIVPEVRIIEIEKPIVIKETVIHEIHSNDGIRKLQIALLLLNLLAMLIAIFKR